MTSFLAMLRRHPTSTLFPYTTLFRSLLADLIDHGAGGDVGGAAGGERHDHLDRLLGRPVLRGDGYRRKQSQRKKQAAEHPDRKSTRLNFSHGYISYAVFCLKKKTD